MRRVPTYRASFVCVCVFLVFALIFVRILVCGVFSCFFLLSVRKFWVCTMTVLFTLYLWQECTPLLAKSAQSRSKLQPGMFFCVLEGLLRYRLPALVLYVFLEKQILVQECLKRGRDGEKVGGGGGGLVRKCSIDIVCLSYRV